MTNNSEKSRLSADDIQDRLLNTAERLFAEKGFDGVSVREITSEAGCNVASVNYYFGGKDGLYLEVFRRRLVILRDVRIEGINSFMASKGDDAVLEELLRAFADAFFAPLRGRGEAQKIMRLIFREMLSPRLPESMFFEEMIGPILQVLLKALRRICPQLDHESALLCIQSFVAQLKHTLLMKEMASDIDRSGWTGFDFERARDHVIAFTAAGIRACC